MKNLLIEMLLAAVLALCIYYGVTLPLLGDVRWAAGIAAGLGGFLAVRIGKKLP